ncbi:PAS domain-containing sensor histidine kinase [uncultured Methylobacterium sp.]|uniref:sensor histidine kinase n=1 Tax=uncultured Methylobacterium sp. TaxID=157278 RepID=UPI0035CC5B45
MNGSIRTGLDDALAAWAHEPMLAATLAGSASAHLVLDGDATTVLHASAAADTLASAVTDAGGTLAPRLSGQIRAAGGTAKPRLVRLRLDPRRIAPPTAFLLARREIDGGALLLLLAAGPLPILRPRAAPTTPRGRAAATAGPEPEPTPDPASPAAGDRFVWRSDADDRLTAISGPCAALLAPVLAGRSWTGLARAGRLTGAETFLSALGERRTFRLAPAVLDLGASGALTIAMSGARLGRGDEAFSGFGGYGVVRTVTASPAVAAEPPQVPVGARTAEPECGAHPDSAIAVDRFESDAPVADADRPAAVALPDTRLASWPPALLTAVRFGGSWTGKTLGGKALSDEASSDEGAVPVRSEPVPTPAHGPVDPPEAASAVAPDSVSAAPVLVANAPPQVPAEPPAAAPAGPDAALSVTEHAAFREIARALGARYAWDDAADAPAEHGGGAVVMPFPVARAVEAEPPEARPEPFAAALPEHRLPQDLLLEDLPTAVLIHRGDAILAVNRLLLDLTGYADLASLREAGLGHLFRGLPPGRQGTDAAASQARGRTLLIGTAGGASRPVAIEHGPALWQGEPADCLILRAAPEADPAGAHAAERLARTVRDDRAADARAVLDALDDGVVTLDPAARILAMNRAAAALFACDPREVVGAGFDTLFETSQREAVRAGLEGPGTQTQAVAAGGRPLDLRVSGHGGTRVAVLRPVADAARTGADGLARPAFLGRLDGAIRAPVEDIVGLADGLLAKPHGPIDDRDRAALREITATGHHLRGLVADLFALATIEAGGLALAVRPLPLNDLVSGCVERLQAEAARGRIVLRTSFAPDLAPLEADEPSLRQAASMVIADAIRATGAGGQVIVSTTPGERGGVALKVRRTGPGMSPEEIARALEPLGADRGAGLGLPLTKALVEANHGHLRISSRKDEGTLVEILLPDPRSRSA